jgi:hypothetical protein
MKQGERGYGISSVVGWITAVRVTAVATVTVVATPARITDSVGVLNDYTRAGHVTSAHLHTAHTTVSIRLDGVGGAHRVHDLLLRLNV